MIQSFTTDMQPIPMYGRCVIDHLDHEGTDIFDAIEDTHKVNDIGEIFGLYADEKYWEPRHLYELSDETVQGKIPIKDPTPENIKFLKEQLNEGPLINKDCEICGVVWYHCQCEK